MALSALGLMLWFGTWAALMIGFSGHVTPEGAKTYPITFVRSSTAPNAQVGVEFEGNLCSVRDVAEGQATGAALDVEAYGSNLYASSGK
jgi:hypothetical protein